MIRRLHCAKCGTVFKLDPEDQADGWQLKSVHIKARKPADHHIEISSGTETERIVIPILVCDSCNNQIPDGDETVAVSMWRPEEETEPNWEHEFGEVME